MIIQASPTPTASAIGAKGSRGMSETLNILVELLNEYRESECALDEDRLTWYAAWLDRTPNLLYTMLKRLGCVEVGLGELEQRIETIEHKFSRTN